MNPNDQKECRCCSKVFAKRKRDAADQWAKREFCSLLCANRSKKQVTPASERFWGFVASTPKAGCWEWIGAKDGGEYGIISAGTGMSPEKAHRLSWEIHFFPVPDGLDVCHACDNPSCVNPNHLMLGTTIANMLDMSRKARMNPESLLNLCPGRLDHHGAGPTSNKEIINGIFE